MIIITLSSWSCPTIMHVINDRWKRNNRCKFYISSWWFTCLRRCDSPFYIFIHFHILFMFPSPPTVSSEICIITISENPRIFHNLFPSQSMQGVCCGEVVVGTVEKALDPISGSCIQCLSGLYQMESKQFQPFNQSADPILVAFGTNAIFCHICSRWLGGGF